MWTILARESQLDNDSVRYTPKKETPERGEGRRELDRDEHTFALSRCWGCQWRANWIRSPGEWFGVKIIVALQKTLNLFFFLQHRMFFLCAKVSWFWFANALLSRWKMYERSLLLRTSPFFSVEHVFLFCMWRWESLRREPELDRSIWHDGFKICSNVQKSRGSRNFPVFSKHCINISFRS